MKVRIKATGTVIDAYPTSSKGGMVYKDANNGAEYGPDEVDFPSLVSTSKAQVQAIAIPVNIATGGSIKVNR